YTSKTSVSKAEPGDLFFYGSGGSVSHVAMYIGDGQVIHASSARTGIKISKANYRKPIKVGKVIK
ncbi:MAG: C40 family peptidase, partial [Lachnospiraceae bacterium]|nr:C40 family peptidase [Lachnospiraceae bacterium]